MSGAFAFGAFQTFGFQVVAVPVGVQLGGTVWGAPKPRPAIYGVTKDRISLIPATAAREHDLDDEDWLLADVLFEEWVA